MPTQEQIDDVLAKVETYRVKKAAAEEAQSAWMAAAVIADAALNAWYSAINNGAIGSVLTTKLLDYLDATHDAAPILANSNVKSADAGDALSELNTAVSVLVGGGASPLARPDDPGQPGEPPGHGGENPGHGGEPPGHGGENPGHGPPSQPPGRPDDPGPPARPAHLPAEPPPPVVTPH